VSDRTQPSEAVLSIKGLTTAFQTPYGEFKAVDNVTLEVRAHERVAVVGESGSGKSMLMLSILRLVPEPGKIVAGEVCFDGRDIAAISARDMADLRGSEIALIFQDPMSSWNPVKRIGRQIAEAMELHRKIERKSIRERVVDLLRKVGIPSPRERARAYPHEFSGGMRQRGMIGMGLSNNPKLLIADEPTTALDVTVQDQVIRLLRDVNEQYGTALILITHNLALVASLAERVVVMYAGRVMERGTAEQIFRAPQHPYTWGLLQSVPRIDQDSEQDLIGIPGSPLDNSQKIAGCKFNPRCRFKIDRCMVEEPGLIPVGDGQVARCWVMMKNTAFQNNDDATNQASHATA
jgi:oligopeptide/dipeptide ABC transporter ATP-binding protein